MSILSKSHLYHRLPHPAINRVGWGASAALSLELVGFWPNSAAFRLEQAWSGIERTVEHCSGLALEQVDTIKKAECNCKESVAG